MGRISLDPRPKVGMIAKDIGCGQVKQVYLKIEASTNFQCELPKFSGKRIPPEVTQAKDWKECKNLSMIASNP